MRGRRFGAVAWGLVTASVLGTVPAAAMPTPGPAAEPAGEVVEPLPDPDVRALAAELGEAASADGVGTSAVGEVTPDRLLVRWVPGVAPADAEAALRSLDLAGSPAPGFDLQVVDVEPVRAADLLLALDDHPLVARVLPDRVVAFETTSEWPREQWGLRNTGQRVRDRRGVAGIDIGARDAWAATRGNRGTVVAVLDTGVDTTHPDLVPSLWVNPREQANGRDDDGNGYVDDLHGADVLNRRGAVYDPSDPRTDLHGTHVAGVIAATDDGNGTVGVAPRVSVMSVKFLEDQQGPIGNAVRAVQYAVANGADVINASWGVPENPRDRDLRLIIAELDGALRDARIPVIAAAGNRGADLSVRPEFPATSTAPNVITVGAVANDGAVAPFSNRSVVQVDVVAPGVDILGPITQRRHAYLSGTSQAAPMVSGIVALAISTTGERDGAALARALRSSTRPYGTLVDGARPSGASRAGLASGPGLLAALGVDLGACRGGAPGARFPDVDRRDVHTSAIDCVASQDLAGGFPDGTYRPADTVTRGQVASFLARLLETAQPLAIPSPDDGQFRDVDGSPHHDNVEALAALGIIGGFADGTFRPSDPVTRDQFASLLVRTYEHAVEGEVRVSGGSFPDVRGSVHERSIRVGAQLGFVQGRTDGSFGPRNRVTRAQMASFLRRSLDKLVNDRVSDVR